MTDRFSDGDQGNNFHVDRANPFAYHGGDFQGIIDRIPYLKNLGITALWITPVYRNIHMEDRGQWGQWGYHGYWPLDFEEVDPHLYTPKEGVPEGSKLYLRELVDTLHRHDIKVILDTVVNHTGYRHPGLSGNPGSIIRPHWFNQAYLECGEDSSLLGLPELDQDNLEVADYFVNVIMDWIEQTGVDCLRMYTARHVQRAFWHYFKTCVKGRHPEVSVLGDALEWDTHRMCEFQKYYSFDFVFDFPLQKLMTDVFINDKSILAFAYPHLSSDGTLGVSNGEGGYSNHNRFVTLLDNHDMPKRFISRAIDRFGGNKDNAAKVYKLSSTFLMTTPGVPQIYYGNEIALEGYGDPDNRRDMPWEIFGGNLEPSFAYPFQREVFAHMKNLIRIRKENKALSYGSLNTLYVDGFIYVYLREFRGNAIIVAINNGHQPMNLPLLVSMEANTAIPPRVRTLLKNRRLTNLLTPAAPSINISEGSFYIQLPGKSAGVYKAE